MKQYKEETIHNVTMAVAIGGWTAGCTWGALVSLGILPAYSGWATAIFVGAAATATVTHLHTRTRETMIRVFQAGLDAERAETARDERRKAGK